VCTLGACAEGKVEHGKKDGGEEVEEVEEEVEEVEEVEVIESATLLEERSPED